jgi:hypothetical protein
MEPFPGMPIKVGKITRPASSSIDSTYQELKTPQDEARAYSTHVLVDGQSKLVIESSFTATFPTVPYFWPRRITNVDGQLVKTFFRRPVAA